MEMELAKAIANYGTGIVCLAVLIALHVYNVRVTLPSLAKDAKEQTLALVSAFREELAAERQQCHDDHQQLAQALAETQRAVASNQTSLDRLLDRQPRTHPK